MEKNLRALNIERFGNAGENTGNYQTITEGVMEDGLGGIRGLFP